MELLKARPTLDFLRLAFFLFYVNKTKWKKYNIQKIKPHEKILHLQQGGQKNLKQNRV